MIYSRFRKAALPLAVAVALGAGLSACSDSQAPQQTASQQTSQAANPCAASNPCAAAKVSENPCAATNPSAAEKPATAANPCAAGGQTASASPPAMNPPALDRSAQPFDVDNEWVQVPFGNAIGDKVRNYGRPAPFIASGGYIADGAMGDLKALGFKTVVSLLSAEEGVDQEQEQAIAAGLNFHGIGVSTKAPSWEQVAAFTEIASNPDNYPILVHCASSNRVGAMWTLYRANVGIPEEIAIQEGRAVGLKLSRETVIREMLANR